MTTSRIRVLAAAAAAAAALSACGSGDNVGGGKGNNKEPLTIGVITSLSGPASVLGGFVKETLDLYVGQVNSSGGIDGRQVQLEYADDQSNPTQAALALRTIAAKKPVALVGPVSSSSCAAIVDKVDQLKIPMVTTCATDSQVTPVRKYTFMSTLPTPGMTEQLANYLKSQGKNNVAVLYDAGDFGKSGLANIKEQGLVQVVDQASYQPKSTTFVPQLTGLISKRPDAIMVWGSGPPLLTIAKEFRQLGASMPLVYSGAAATPLFLAPAGAAGNGVIMASSLANVLSSVPDTNPSKAVVEKLGQAYQSKYGKPYSQFTADTCGAWNVLVEAIKKAGTEPEKVRDAMESTPIVGCHGTYTYSSEDHRGLKASDVWVAVDQNAKLAATPFSVQAAG
jgi:branched-chain amino acid transport system substrate-binding protein